jgi:hypothetical protein
LNLNNQEGLHWEKVSNAFPLHKRFITRSGREFSVVSVDVQPTGEGYFIVSLMDCKSRYVLQLPSVYIEEMMDEL